MTGRKGPGQTCIIGQAKTRQDEQNRQNRTDRQNRTGKIGHEK